MFDQIRNYFFPPAQPKTPEAPVVVGKDKLKPAVRHSYDRLARRMNLECQKLQYTSVEDFRARAREDLKSGKLTGAQLRPIQALVLELKEVTEKNAIPEREQALAIESLKKAEQLVGERVHFKDNNLLEISKVYLAAGLRGEAVDVMENIDIFDKVFPIKMKLIEEDKKGGKDVEADLNALEQQVMDTEAGHYLLLDLMLLRARVGSSYKHLIPQCLSMGENSLDTKKSVYSKLAEAAFISGEDPKPWIDQIPYSTPDDDGLMGELYARIGMLDKSIDILKKGKLEIWTRDKILKLVFAKYLEQEQFDKAIELLRTFPVYSEKFQGAQGRHLSSYFLDPFFKAALQSKGDPGVILNKLEKNINLFGDRTEILKGRLELLRDANQLDLAIPFIKKIPNHYAKFEAAVGFSYLKGQNMDHQEAIKQAESFERKNELTKQIILILRQWQGEDIEERLKTYQEELFKEGYSHALVYFAYTLFTLGRDPLPVLRDVQKMANPRTFDWNLLVEVYSGMGFYQEAERVVEKMGTEDEQVKSYITIAKSILQPKEFLLSR